jgi:hypothetical protein
MDRTWQSAEYDSWFVPYHQEVLRAYQSHFCLRVIAEDRGFQSDVSDIQTETEQICQAELREWGNCRACQRFPEVFCGNRGWLTPHAALHLPPLCARYDDVPGETFQNNIYNVNNAYNMHKVDKHIIVYLPSFAPIYSIQFPCKALHHRQQCRIRFRCSKSDQEPSLCHCCPSRPQQRPHHPLPGTAWLHKGAGTPPYSRNES